MRDGFRGDPRLVARRMKSAIRRRLARSRSGRVRWNGGGNPFEAHGRAVLRHKARRFRGTVSLFRSEEFSTRLQHAPKLGWDALARNVTVHPVPCGHSAMLSDPTAVRFIAETMTTYLSPPVL